MHPHPRPSIRPSIHPSIHPSSNMANTSFVLWAFRGMLILKNAGGRGVSISVLPSEKSRGKKRQRTHNILYFSHARDHVQGRILYLVSRICICILRISPSHPQFVRQLQSFVYPFAVVSFWYFMLSIASSFREHLALSSPTFSGLSLGRLLLLSWH